MKLPYYCAKYETRRYSGSRDVYFVDLVESSRSLATNPPTSTGRYSTFELAGEKDTYRVYLTACHSAGGRLPSLVVQFLKDRTTACTRVKILMCTNLRDLSRFETCCAIAIVLRVARRVSEGCNRSVPEIRGPLVANLSYLIHCI